MVCLGLFIQFGQTGFFLPVMLNLVNFLTRVNVKTL